MTNLLGIKGFASILKKKSFVCGKSDISLVRTIKTQYSFDVSLAKGSDLILSHINEIISVFKGIYDVCSKCF